MITPEQLLAVFEAEAERYALAVGAEMDCEGEKPEAKLNAIRRLMQHPNELTGKPHSASSAEAIAETDPEYGAFLRRRRDAVIAKLRAQGRLEAARLRVQLALALVGPKERAP